MLDTGLILISFSIGAAHLSQKIARAQIFNGVNYLYRFFLASLQIKVDPKKRQVEVVPVFLWNILKGAFCVSLVNSWCYDQLARMLGVWNPVAPAWLSWVLVIAVMIGHQKSPWHQEHASHSASLGLGALFILAPISALFGLFTYFLGLMGSKSAALSELSAVLLVVLSYFAFYPLRFEVLIGLVGIWQVMIENENAMDRMLQTN